MDVLMSVTTKLGMLIRVPFANRISVVENWFVTGFRFYLPS